ncbi:MAG: glycerophosphodiester phosphodiesterase [Planctomycetota bacterium]
MFRSVLRDFCRLCGPFVSYFVLFRIALFVLLAPLWSWVLNGIHAYGGLPALGNTAIVGFLLSPRGWVFVLLFLGGCLCGIWIERSGFIIIAERSRWGIATSGAQALWLAVRRLPSTFGAALLLSIIAVLITLPFLAVIGWIASGILSQHDINYYLKSRSPEFIAAAVKAGIVALAWAVVMVWAYLRFYFTLPVALMESRHPWGVVRRSTALSGGMRRLLLGIVAAWIAVICAVNAAGATAYNAFARWYLDHLGPSLVDSVYGVVCLMALLVLLSAAGYFLFSAVDSLLALELYRTAFRRKNGEFSSAERTLILSETGLVSWLRGGVAPVALWIVLLAWAGGVLLLSPLQRTGTGIEHHVVITAHRGCSRQAPENTLAAIRKAIEVGADMAEIDVQETADGVVVVTHDTDFMRIAGDPRKIWETTYEEMRALDAGGWFSPAFKGERIPTLEEAIEAARDRIQLNIELKYNGHDKDLAAAVIRIVGDTGFRDQCVITSLKYEALEEVARLAPEQRTGFIVAETLGRAERLPVDMLVISLGLLHRDLVQRARAAGKSVHVWTVNKGKDMERCLDFGVDGILTDEPAMLAEILRKRAAASDAERVIGMFRRWLRD